MIDGETKVLGIFGYPVSHSLSPIMHNLAFKETGLNFVYVPFPVKPSDLEGATQALRTLGILGINVTIPHKEKIIPYLDDISPEAKIIGAVNTVVNREGRLIGYNTDGEGFVQSLRAKGISLDQKEILVLGAGGAALAICVSLVKEKIKRLVLINRTYSKAIKLADRLKGIAPRVNIEVFEYSERNTFPGHNRINLLINATSLGMHDEDPAPINLQNFPSSVYVYDIVYHRKTKLLEEAEKRGMMHQGGLDMLVFQGALAFEIWTGKKAPLYKMKKVAEESLRRKT